MDIMEEKRKRIIAELNRGMGSLHISQHPVPLEPEFVSFNERLQERSFIDRVFSSITRDRSSGVKIIPVPSTEYSILHIKPSAEDKGGLAVAEQMLVVLPLIEPAFFEITGHSGKVMIQMAVARKEAGAIMSLISAWYPNASVFEDKDGLADLKDLINHARLYVLREPPVLKIKTDFKTEPYITLCGALSGLGGSEAGCLQILIQKSQKQNLWRENLIAASRDPWDPKRSCFTDWPDLPRQVDKKVSKPLYLVSIRIAGNTLNVVDRIEAHLSQYEEENGFIQVSQSYPVESIINRSVLASGVLLATEEAGALVHIPCPEAPFPGLVTASPSAPPPKLATENNLVVLGVNHHRGVDTTVGISSEWLSRHMVICGQTGVGKTTLLKRLLFLVSKGYGLTFIDPNGDAAEEFLSLIPSHRVEDTIYFHPADPKYAPALNILQHSDRREAELICSDLVTAFERFYGNYWGPQTEMILRQCLRTLLLTPGEKYLPDVRRLILDETYRNQIMKTLADPDLLDFWLLQFPRLPKNACNSLLNKLSKFLDNHLIRPVISQPNRIDFQTVMEKGMVFIANLSKGLLGEDNAYLLGSFLLSKFQILTVSRASLSRERRKLFPIIVDELHNYAETKANAKSLNSFFSEARKYNVPFIGATQYLDQLHESIRNAIFGTVGTLVIFRCGTTDSLILKREIGRFQEQDILNLGVGEALVRMGRASDTFLIKVTDTPIPLPHHKQKIIQDSYKKYYQLRTEVVMTQRTVSVPTSNSERTETRINHSPAEQTFLNCVHNHPTHSVTRIYAELKLSGYTGDKLKRELIRQGYIKEITTHLGKRSRIAKFLLLTPKGFDTLGINFGSEYGKGGPLHRYWQSVIKTHAEGKGYEVSVEESISGINETVDLGLRQNGLRTAVEISVTSSAEHEVNNIKKCLKAGYTKIIVLTLEEDKMLEIQNLIKKVLSQEEQSKVTIGLVYDFDRFF